MLLNLLSHSVGSSLALRAATHPVQAELAGRQSVLVPTAQVRDGGGPDPHRTVLLLSSARGFIGRDTSIAFGAPCVRGGLACASCSTPTSDRVEATRFGHSGVARATGLDVRGTSLELALEAWLRRDRMSCKA